MTDSRLEYRDIRGLRYALRRWGDPAAPMLFVLHGWLDVSATFAPLIEPLLPRFQVIAPDWRGFGHTQWPQDGYWFMDYVADLDAILDSYSPQAPARLAGHSMGGQVAAHYAGLRPSRVAQLACLDSLTLPDTAPDLLLQRQRQWLDQLREPLVMKAYAGYEDLARLIRRLYPGMLWEQSLFIARCWGRCDEDGIRFSHDPKHRRVFPVPYDLEDSMHVWRQVTARTLLLFGGRSALHGGLQPEDRDRRQACFRDRQVDVIEGAGHMLHFDAPSETGRRLAAFFA